MKTYILTVDEMIEYFQKAKKYDIKYVVFGKSNLTQATAPSKKKSYFKLGFSLAGDVYNEEDVHPLFYSKNTIPFCGLMIKSEDEKYLNKDIIKKIKEKSEKNE